MLRILKNYHDVSPFLAIATDAADKMRDELGWLSRNVYETYALKGNFWVASNDGNYAGHLLFGGKYPDLRIFQVSVEEKFRGNGIGRALIEDLSNFGQKRDYLSIIARVASDLEANNFWESNGFRTVKTVPGGKSKNRTINIRVRVLDVPSLLSILSEIGNKTRQSDARELLQLASLDRRSTTFALDVNVLLEVLRDRSRVEEARRLIQQAVSGSLRLFLTQEFIVETSRQNTDSTEDQLVNFASQISVLPQPAKATIEAVINKLREIVFQGRPINRKSIANDESDLKHIAHAIYYKLDGLVTFDKQLLNSHEEIREQFDIEILTPSDFWQDQEIDDQFDARIRLGEQDVHLIKTDFPQSHMSFLHFNNPQISQIESNLPTEGLSNLKGSVVIELGKEEVGESSWVSTKKPQAETSLYINIRQKLQITETIVQHLIETALYLGSSQSSRTIRLVLPSDHSTSVQLAKNMGFHAPPDLPVHEHFSTLVKVVAPSLVSVENWQSFKRQVSFLTGATLPESMPTEKDVASNGIKLKLTDGKDEFLDRISFERLFRPSLFLFPGRQGMLVPIRPAFAQDLLGYDNNQPQLFATRQAMIRTERVYFRSTPNAAKLQIGTPIVFYVSEISKAVGCAIVKSSITLPWQEARVRFEGQGVLDNRELEELADSNGMIHVFSFFSYQPFSSAIAIRKLKTLGLGRLNFITFEEISNSVLSDLCYEGLSLGD